ncbi:hypothetical protein BT63DRAFT_456138 [Microthyrium microscopicum]|uniref:Uncharacterized protein n=1 Tax=Microthyrium microscopicum TaxID=703497 RepID=A0A6A6UA69_9PEZI|nr:hypothetical protein BT63DRAFT_456138 [Microthyrium microscopicum]
MILQPNRRPIINGNTPGKKLERSHSIILDRILKRNVQRVRRRPRLYSSVEDDFKDYEEMKDIDYELRVVYRFYPTSWWVSTTLPDGIKDSEAMEKTGSLMWQFHH